MSHNDVINEKKKALLAYKEKILDEIKYYEKSIDDFRTNHKNNSFYDDHADSSDSEDDFPCAVEAGPSITQLKLQQAMLKTCLHATQELTSLMILQSEVDVLIEEPKFEGERPVSEAGTWREVTAECRIDLIPFTMTFFMHIPDRKFAPPSYRGLRVVPVKSTHELELSKSVLHSLKLPSDAVEVLRSYAAGYRSRRTTLARLANKFNNSLYMEPHAEGGFVLKCADLLEVSWRLENKWSPVAPFHHRMKFDLEYMDESYIKIITQAHKQLLDPTLQADDRTLLLAKIITTCLEARGPIDPESDLESKTTDRDNYTDKRDSETEKRDSEVMAPPKSLPKKGKQKTKDSIPPNNAMKRSMDDDDGNKGAKKMKNNVAVEVKKSFGDNNPRKSKMNDVAPDIGKKRKLSEVNKVVSAKNVDDVNTKGKEIEDGSAKTHSKMKIVKETAMSDDTNTAKDTIPKSKTKNLENGNTKNKEIEGKNAKTQSKQKIVKKSTMADDAKAKQVETIAKDTIPKSKTKNLEDGNTKSKEIEGKNAKTQFKTKNVKESTMADDVKAKNNEITAKDTTSKPKSKNLEDGNTKSKEIENKNSKTQSKTKILKETAMAEDIKAKNNDTTGKDTIPKSKPKDLKEPTTAKSKTKILKDAKNPVTEDNDNPKDGQNRESTAKNKMAKEPNETEKVKNVTKAKNVTSKEIGNTDINNASDKKKTKNVASGKSKENIDSNKMNKDAAKIKIAEKTSAVSKNTDKNVDKIDKGKNIDGPKVRNVASAKNDKETAKKALEKNINVASTKNNEANKASEKIVKSKERLPEIANKVSEKSKTVINNVKNIEKSVKKIAEKNATNLRNKDKTSQITAKVSEKVVKDIPAPIKEVSKRLNSNLIPKNPKEINKNTKKPIIHKIASHRNSLKPQNPPKTLKAGNIKILSAGNTEKENGGKGTKIPQKKMSIISEGSSKKNMLRMSPRQIPSKFKTLSQQTFKQKMVKTTNIPRLLKKPAPKV